MTSIEPTNLTAQLHHVAAGNPPSTQADSAISNCFPGLESDFRNVWHRIFEGIVLHEADNYVVDADDSHAELKGRRLLYIGDQPAAVQAVGPALPEGGSNAIASLSNPGGAWALEWSNLLADVIAGHQGKEVTCWFTNDEATTPVLPPALKDRDQLHRATLRVRRFFATDGGHGLAVIDEALLEPGELTESLCSPWQNDYRECACYYWAASRPDYVNVDPNETGESTGNSWLSKSRTPKGYILDDRKDPRLVSYVELFRDWEDLLRFIVGGDDDATPPLPADPAP